MTDFFISYTSADERWAEWIGYILEEQNLKVTLQAWDFRPGSNFVLEMQKAAGTADRTLMVLSPDYLKSQFATPEWAAAFANDPQGLERKLVPVMVRECQPTGLLKTLIHINLVGLTEDDARMRLLAGVSSQRAKPSARPAFPGAAARHDRKDFPGPPAPRSVAPYMPKLRGAPSDIDKRRFVKGAFETMRSHFEHALAELARQTPDLDYEFQPISAQEFTAEIFINGASAAACRIWQGGMFSQDGISYAEGRQHFGNNSCNEAFSINADQGELSLSSMMGGFGMSCVTGDLDMKHLTPDKAADYLWRRFVERLER